MFGRYSTIISQVYEAQVLNRVLAEIVIDYIFKCSSVIDLGKFGAVFASIPAPIVAALYCLLFAYVGK